MEIKLTLFMTYCTHFVFGHDEILVNLKQGIIRGYEDSTSEGNTFLGFLGIPYAEPPIGDLRYQVPQPHKGWKGIRDGRKQPSRCIQLDYRGMLKYGSSGHLGEEDCLVLNIFTQEISSPVKPVMAFIHGGGYTGGGADAYLPDYFLSEDIVLVVIQYRLGALGFLSTEDSVIPSNIGLRDQVMALRWIQENIHAFGGNPQNVTIFGSSAGAGSTHGHILSDYSIGLFSRAILQSGSLLCPFAKMSEPRDAAMELGTLLGCFKQSSYLEGKDKSVRLLECLRDLPAAHIQEMTRKQYKWSYVPKRTVPYIDDDFFSEEIETSLKKGKEKPIDVIYGVNQNEGLFVTHSMLLMDDQRRAIKDHFDTIGPISLAFDKESNAIEMSEAAFDYYVGGIKNEKEDYFNITRMISDRHFILCSEWAASHHSQTNSKHNKKTFFYELHYRGKSGFLNLFLNSHLKEESGVSHGDEIIFMWPMNHSSKRNATDIHMTKMFIKLWTNFAKYGNPTPDGSLGFIWDPYTKEDSKRLKIQPKPVMISDTRTQEKEFWSGLPTKQNKLLFSETKKWKKDEF